MSSTSQTILILYAAISIIGVSIGLIVFRSTRVGFHVRTATREQLEQRESYWGVAVIAFLVIALGGTIFSIPYWTAGSTGPVPQTISVTARQFAWTLNPPRVRAGEKTRLEIRSVDVSHGLGLYDPSNVLQKQVNVLPGVTQNLVYTFNTPGTWHIRCLEFCGVDHHLMQNALQVTQ